MVAFYLASGLRSVLYITLRRKVRVRCTLQVTPYRTAAATLPPGRVFALYIGYS